MNPPDELVEKAVKFKKLSPEARRLNQLLDTQRKALASRDAEIGRLREALRDVCARLYSWPFEDGSTHAANIANALDAALSPSTSTAHIPL